jgi:hypothetical protein
LPIGSPDGLFEGLLPPGLEIAFAHDDVTTLVFGEQPEAAGRSKFKALKEVDPDSPLAVEYATDIDQWKGRSDEVAETAEMHVALFVRNVGRDDVTVTTTDGDITFKGGDGGLVETIAGTMLVGAGTTPPEPPDPPDPGDVTGTFTAFTAANPTVVTMDAQDDAMLEVGSTMTLEALTGDPDAMAAINGVTATVVSKGPVALDIDLSAVDVTGLTADFLLPEAPARSAP